MIANAWSWMLWSRYDWVSAGLSSVDQSLNAFNSIISSFLPPSQTAADNNSVVRYCTNVNKNRLA